MINDNDTDSIDIKEIPQFLSKVAQHIIQTFIKPGTFNSRYGINDIYLYSDNDLVGNDKNYRIQSKTNLQTCFKRILISDINTDKHLDVEEYFNSNKNLPTHQQKIIYRETVQYDLQDKKIMQVNYSMGKKSNGFDFVNITVDMQKT